MKYWELGSYLPATINSFAIVNNVLYKRLIRSEEKILKEKLGNNISDVPVQCLLKTFINSMSWCIT